MRILSFRFRKGPSKGPLDPPRLSTVGRSPSVLTRLLTTVSLLSLASSAARAAEDDPAVTALKQKAQQAFIEKRFAEAIALDLEIAGRPESSARRYAVQMLGTLYEDNLVDLSAAIRWDQEFLAGYADVRQVPFYRQKIATLEKLLPQQDIFAAYQKIRFANQGDEVLVAQYEALLKEHPDFFLKDKIQAELGYAYARMDKHKESYLAFKALAQSSGKAMSAEHMKAYQAAALHWNESSRWGLAVLGLVLAMWGVVLWGKPWQRITRRSLWMLLGMTLAWVALNVARLPSFYKIETTGYPIVIPDTVVYTGVGLNLTVLVWLFLLRRAAFWQRWSRAVRLVVSPVLVVVMTTSVLYLLVIWQPNGPQVVDVFGMVFHRWTEDFSRPTGPVVRSAEAHEKNVASGSATRSAIAPKGEP